MWTVYALPIMEKVLIYAPLHNLSALVNRAAAQSLASGLKGERDLHHHVKALFAAISTGGHALPKPQVGPLIKPLFLGLIPTRACNMACQYCDFGVEKDRKAKMSLPLVRQALDAYVDLLERGDSRLINVHFFGGEPFFAAEIVHFAVAYATHLARNLSMETHFEVTTNGVYNQNLAYWISDQFDTIVLSLDGPEEVQERQRPSLNGHPSFPHTYRNAKIFSDGLCELILRVCVTDDTVSYLPEIANWMVDELQPTTVCFETVWSTQQATAASLKEPDPIEFAYQFHLAAQYLETYGINTVLSTADVSECHFSICPVGKDALIVSPNGNVDACYLPEQVWRDTGLDMRLGRLKGAKFEIDFNDVERLRNLSVENKAGCASCLCRFHCAGGCHVRHYVCTEGGQYNPQCVQTRLVTIANLLRRLDQSEMATNLLTHPLAMEKAVFQSSDLLCEQLW